MPLRPGSGCRRAEEGQRRRAPFRPHRQSLGHREPREGSDPGPHAPQPGDPRPPDGLQRPRLQGASSASATSLPPVLARKFQAAGVQGCQPGRRTLDPHPEGSAAHEAARTDLGADGRIGLPAQGAPVRASRQGRTGKPRQRTQRLDADHARDAQIAGEARRGS